MSEMVERVARAIYDTDPIGVREWEDAPTTTREDCFVCARAAIAAMREPTEKVGDAGRRAMSLYGAHDCEVSPVEIFNAMIDGALK